MLADTTMSSTVISFEIYGVPSSQVAQGQPCLRTIYNKLWSWWKVYVRGQDVARLVTCLPNVHRVLGLILSMGGGSRGDRNSGSFSWLLLSLGAWAL